MLGAVLVAGEMVAVLFALAVKDMRSRSEISAALGVAVFVHLSMVTLATVHVAGL